jgi:hypothetical protein
MDVTRKISGYSMLIFFLGISVFNGYVYLVKRILKLENKNFHLMMFTCLQLCYLSAFISNSAYLWLIYHTECFEVNTCESNKMLYRVSFLIYWMLNVTAHSIFALKYWVLSQKVR